jgi:hypothetical protein
MAVILQVSAQACRAVASGEGRARERKHTDDGAGHHRAVLHLDRDRLVCQLHEEANELHGCFLAALTESFGFQVLFQATNLNKSKSGTNKPHRVMSGGPQAGAAKGECEPAL